MKNTSFAKRLMALLSVLIMVLSCSFTALADDNTDDNKPAGTPVISVISGNSYEIEPGSENKVAIRIRNTSSSVAKSMVVIPSVADAADNPLTIAVDGPSNSIGTVSANGERTINFIVKCDKSAATKTYGVNLKFTFLNNDGVSYENSSTIYFKLKNTSSTPVFNFANYK